MLQWLGDLISGIYNAIISIFDVIGSFLGNLVAFVSKVVYVSDFVKVFINGFPMFHFLMGTLTIAISIGVILKILGR